MSAPCSSLNSMVDTDSPPPAFNTPTTTISGSSNLSPTISSLSSASSIQPATTPSVWLTPLEQTIFDTILAVCKLHNLQVNPRVAGGWVRDKLLDLASEDIDIALEGIQGETFAHIVNEYLASQNMTARTIAVIKSNPAQSKHLNTATFRLHGQAVDVNNLRTEVYQSDSRIPLVQLGSPLDDVMRRDFTINSMFYNITSGCVEDVCGTSLMDLHRGVLRTPLPPFKTFNDDPLRVLRCARFVGRFGFRVTRDIEHAASHISVHRNLLRKVSRERFGIEIKKMLEEYGRVPLSFSYLCRWGLRSVVFPLPTPVLLPAPTKRTDKSEVGQGKDAALTRKEKRKKTEEVDLFAVNGSGGKPCPVLALSDPEQEFSGNARTKRMLLVPSVFVDTQMIANVPVYRIRELGHRNVLAIQAPDVLSHIQRLTMRQVQQPLSQTVQTTQTEQTIQTTATHSSPYHPTLIQDDHVMTSYSWSVLEHLHNSCVELYTTFRTPKRLTRVDLLRASALNEHVSVDELKALQEAQEAQETSENLEQDEQLILSQQNESSVQTFKEVCSIIPQHMTVTFQSTINTQNAQASSDQLTDSIISSIPIVRLSHQENISLDKNVTAVDPTYVGVSPESKIHHSYVDLCKLALDGTIPPTFSSHASEGENTIDHSDNSPSIDEVHNSNEKKGHINCKKYSKKPRSRMSLVMKALGREKMPPSASMKCGLLASFLLPYYGFKINIPGKQHRNRTLINYFVLDCLKLAANDATLTESIIQCALHLYSLSHHLDVLIELTKDTVITSTPIPTSKNMYVDKEQGRVVFSDSVPPKLAKKWTSFFSLLGETLQLCREKQKDILPLALLLAESMHQVLLSQLPSCGPQPRWARGKKSHTVTSQKHHRTQLSRITSDQPPHIHSLECGISSFNSNNITHHSHFQAEMNDHKNSEISMECSHRHSLDPLSSEKNCSISQHDKVNGRTGWNIVETKILTIGGIPRGKIHVTVVPEHVTSSSRPSPTSSIFTTSRTSSSSVSSLDSTGLAGSAKMAFDTEGFAIPKPIAPTMATKTILEKTQLPKVFSMMASTPHSTPSQTPVQGTPLSTPNTITPVSIPRTSMTDLTLENSDSDPQLDSTQRLNSSGNPKAVTGDGLGEKIANLLGMDENREDLSAKDLTESLYCYPEEFPFYGRALRSSLHLIPQLAIFIHASGMAPGLYVWRGPEPLSGDWIFQQFGVRGIITGKLLDEINRFRMMYPHCTMEECVSLGKGLLNGTVLPVQEANIAAIAAHVKSQTQKSKD